MSKTGRMEIRVDSLFDNQIRDICKCINNTVSEFVVKCILDSDDYRTYIINRVCWDAKARSNKEFYKKYVPKSKYNKKDK